MNKCQAAALLDPTEEILLCPNEAEETRRITFGTWHVYVMICSAHTELWDSLEETPMIVKKIGRKPDNPIL